MNKNVKIAIPVIIFVVAGVVILIGIETNMPSDEIIDSCSGAQLDNEGSAGLVYRHGGLG